MRNIMILALAAGTLAACERGYEEPARGVGFGNYSQYEQERAAREAALAARVVPQAQVNSVVGGGISPDELEAAGLRTAVAPAAVAAPAPAPAPAPTAAPAQETVTVRTVTAATPRLSDENDFNAVLSRETIESDAERLAALAAQREEVQPTAVPQRPTDAGPNIVAYALNAPNAKGQEWYSRFIFSSQARYVRNCAAFPTPDAAQREFLARGGPERDRLGLDPDGDGFACGWDPAPFRAAAGM